MQGIIDSTGTDTWQIFLLYVCKNKFFLKSCLTLTPSFIGVDVSVRYVSSTPVVLDARLNKPLRRR